MSLPYLKTNTTVDVVDTKGQPVTGMQGLEAFKMPLSPEIIAMRDIPAGLGFSFRFRDFHDISQYHYLMEGTTRYRVVGVSPYDTPHGRHVRVDAEMRAGT